MARSTLSFFTRLFSSKKKKILEKRNQENRFDEVNFNENQDDNSSYEKSQSLGVKNPHVSAQENALHADNKQLVYESSPNSVQGDALNNVSIPYDDSDTSYSAYSEESHETLPASHGEEQYINENMSVTPDDLYKESDAAQTQSYEEKNGIQEDSSHDDSLEYDSMVLLSKLEQLMIKLSDSTVQKSIPLVTDALIEMTNHVVEFAEQLPVSDQKKISLQTLLSRDEQNYKVLNSKFIESERLAIEISRITDGANPQEAFVDLSNDLLRIINVYLSASVKAFKSNRISEQWKTLYTGFFVNLTKSVRSSQANQQN